MLIHFQLRAEQKEPHPQDARLEDLDWIPAQVSTRAQDCKPSGRHSPPERYRKRY